MKQYNAYAGPSIWGDWQVIGSHTGVASFKITAEPIGSTVLRCRVRYFKTDSSQVTEEWLEEITVKTGNCIATIEVSFMGVPLGSAVTGTIDP